jgi:hypothetical protein
VGAAAGRALDLFRRQSGICGEPLAPVRTPALGPGLCLAQHVTFGNAADELPFLVEDGNPADA